MSGNPSARGRIGKRDTSLVKSNEITEPIAILLFWEQKGVDERTDERDRGKGDRFASDL